MIARGLVELLLDAKRIAIGSDLTHEGRDPAAMCC
jgi:hypothetical protein